MDNSDCFHPQVRKYYELFLAFLYLSFEGQLPQGPPVSIASYLSLRIFLHIHGDLPSSLRATKHDFSSHVCPFLRHILLVIPQGEIRIQ